MALKTTKKSIWIVYEVDDVGDTISYDIKVWEEYYIERDRMINEYKKQGKRKEIQSALGDLSKKYKTINPDYPKELCFLTGDWRK